jgi:UDP-N-acetylglucosamine transferase subunit ALG13
MILVTTGTNGAPFDRLLVQLARWETAEELVVQHGPSTIRIPNARNFEYMHFDELAGLIREARIVVTHGGVGSILVALANGHRPVVVPRLARFGEVVDDHQLELARRLHDEHLVVLAAEPSTLPRLLAVLDSTAAASVAPTPPALAAELKAYLTGVLDGAGEGRGRELHEAARG